MNPRRFLKKTKLLSFFPTKDGNGLVSSSPALRLAHPVLLSVKVFGPVLTS
uniref:Tail tubular protein B n=1 Tax=uncultured marine virus TaxID=186617 RepID=A0A0F7L8N5_9VIRU|nr:Tail tubular protein B [uncultured marine virus]